MLEIYVDGSCRANGSDKSIGGIGVIIYKDKKKFLTFSQRLREGLTNNDAEYLALIKAIEFIQRFKIESIIYSDSKLIVNQSKGIWKTKEKKLLKYVQHIQTAISYSNIEIKWIPRIKNIEADKLAQEITSKEK